MPMRVITVFFMVTWRDEFVFRKAADQGHPHASYNLAVGHMKGLRTDLLEKGYVYIQMDRKHIKIVRISTFITLRIVCQGASSLDSACGIRRCRGGSQGSQWSLHSWGLRLKQTRYGHESNLLVTAASFVFDRASTFLFVCVLNLNHFSEF